MRKWLDYVAPGDGVYVNFGHRLGCCNVAARTDLRIWVDIGPSGLEWFDAGQGLSVQGWCLVCPARASRESYESGVLRHLLPEKHSLPFREKSKAARLAGIRIHARVGFS